MSLSPSDASPQASKEINRLLVANRGEIASRIMRTCRILGVETVAVFSDADAQAPFVREADIAVRIGPAPSRQSYLAVDKILDAAVRTGADAIHPGFGFLSENADFARAVREAGLIFVGPSAEAIAVMGSKIEAKERVSAAGVPIVPGYNGQQQETEVLAAKALEVGFPLLLKASAGGGGKGMRVLRSPEGLNEAIDAARREAEKSFSDGSLMIERYVERPRHIEFQILGDQHGKVVHLFERECSVQRRHQKIIEETPSVALSPELRRKMGQAAVAVGEAIGYHNAGTVEFILSPQGEFFFLEVNTRLQVEHPITEMVTGVDLVAEQIKVAEGRALGFAQSDIKVNGAAVECRIYAEDPNNGFLPATGRLVDWHLPPMEGVRLDSGVESGQEVSVHYDPMLAKLITHGDDRRHAHRRMTRALRALSVQGVTTNRAFLLDVLAHPVYKAGDLTTHFIDEHMPKQTAPVALAVVRRAAVAVTLKAWAARRAGQSLLPGLEPGWRNNPFADQKAVYAWGETQISVCWHNLGGGRLRVSVDDQDAMEVVWLGEHGADVLYEDGFGVRRRVRVLADGVRWFVQDLDGAVALEEVPRFPEPGGDDVEGGCLAPMPGQVLRVEVEAGQQVQAGDVLLILEAMKMEHPMRAPHDGVIAQVLVEPGQQVEADEVLIVMDGAED